MEEMKRNLNDYSKWDRKQLRDASLVLHAAKEEFFRLKGQGVESHLGTTVNVRWGGKSVRISEAQVNSLIEAVALAATARLVGDDKAFPEQQYYPYPD